MLRQFYNFDQGISDWLCFCATDEATILTVNINILPQQPRDFTTLKVFFFKHFSFFISFIPSIQGNSQQHALMRYHTFHISHATYKCVNAGYLIHICSTLVLQILHLQLVDSSRKTTKSYSTIKEGTHVFVLLSSSTSMNLKLAQKDIFNTS